MEVKKDFTFQIVLSIFLLIFGCCSLYNNLHETQMKLDKEVSQHIKKVEDYISSPLTGDFDEDFNQNAEIQFFEIYEIDVILDKPDFSLLRWSQVEKYKFYFSKLQKLVEDKGSKIK